MSSPNLPNTLAIAQGVVTLLGTATFPTSVDGATAYATIKLGALKDPTENVPWATVTALRGTSKHYGAGGVVDEKPVFRVTSGVSYQDSTQAEIDILTIRDAVIPIFQTHSTLGGVANVFTLVIQNNAEDYGYLLLLGTTYRIHMFNIIVSQQYHLAQGVID